MEVDKDRQPPFAKEIENKMDEIKENLKHVETKETVMLPTRADIEVENQEKNKFLIQADIENKMDEIKENLKHVETKEKIMLPTQAGIPVITSMSITDHKSESSYRIYTKPSEQQKKNTLSSLINVVNLSEAQDLHNDYDHEYDDTTINDHNTINDHDIINDHNTINNYDSINDYDSINNYDSINEHNYHDINDHNTIEITSGYNTTEKIEIQSRSTFKEFRSPLKDRTKLKNLPLHINVTKKNPTLGGKRFLRRHAKLSSKNNATATIINNYYIIADHVADHSKALDNIYYSIATIHNKLVNNYHLEIGLYLVVSDALYDTINIIHNTDISVCYKTVDNYRKKIYSELEDEDM
ncbi:4382_t:CDS:2 [Scutellospora calospora]|uniref:4382_t:CDS:1 n=1 Tax=Scutellospora calospora TaxID=85575 RepID=A0ACA9K5Q5_9GLOM|nr:4382_t:CDS:2 [Scutellospora calospora]